MPTLDENRIMDMVVK